MTTRTLMAAAMAAVFTLAIQPATPILTTQALARAPAPLVPTALVEDVKSATAEVEFMDYVGPGQVIRLQPRDVLVLSYLKSCAHETITGGTVSVGSEQSEVQGGKIARAKVACDGGKIQLSSQQANASGASAFRLQSVARDRTLYALPPMIQVPRIRSEDSRMLVIERTDKPGRRFEIEIGDDLAQGGFLDLAKANIKPLSRGATYSASLGSRKITFKVDAKAKSGKRASKAPIVSRLLRFTPG